MSAAGVHRQTAATLALLGALAAVALAIAFYRATDWTAPFPRDATGLAIGRDFFNFWMAGHAAHAPDPGRYYDLEAYNRALADVIGHGYPPQTWSYPPSQLLIAAPFGGLGYRLALLIWTMAGAAAAYFSLRRIDRRMAAFVFAAPAATFAVMSGQSSLIATALLLGGLAMLERRPLAAGLLFGLISLKPQLALLLPVALIAGRHWRCLAGAAATTLIVIAATTALYGLEVWRDYFALGLPAQNAVLANTAILATESMPTVFMNLHRAGLGYAAAMTMQMVAAGAAAAAVFWGWRRPGEATVKYALLLAGSVTATPYLMAYDTLPLAAAGLWLLAREVPDARGRVLIKVIWWLPFLQLVLGHHAIPGPALIAPAMVLWALHELTTKAAVARCEPPPASSVNLRNPRPTELPR
jgi:hypothetical protein